MTTCLLKGSVCVHFGCWFRKAILCYALANARTISASAGIQSLTQSSSVHVTSKQITLWGIAANALDVLGGVINPGNHVTVGNNVERVAFQVFRCDVETIFGDESVGSRDTNRLGLGLSARDDRQSST